MGAGGFTLHPPHPGPTPTWLFFHTRSTIQGPNGGRLSSRIIALSMPSLPATPTATAPVNHARLTGGIASYHSFGPACAIVGTRGAHTQVAEAFGVCSSRSQAAQHKRKRAHTPVDDRVQILLNTTSNREHNEVWGEKLRQNSKFVKGFAPSTEGYATSNGVTRAAFAYSIACLAGLWRKQARVLFL